MDIILMIDISGSMDGYKIAAVSDALENIKESLIDYGGENESVRISIQLFSREVTWYTDRPTPIGDFQWEEPRCTGMTSLGMACSDLTDYLRKHQLSDDIKILLISDGCPTDDYEEGLKELNALATFRDSKRYAIGMGDEADIYSLQKFTNDVDNVYCVTDLDRLLDCIKNSLVDSNLSPISSDPDPFGCEPTDWE